MCATDSYQERRAEKDTVTLDEVRGVDPLRPTTGQREFTVVK